MPLRLHPDVRTADTDDGTVLLQLRTGRYWQLNNTGGYILRELLAGNLPGDVATGLAARYDIEPERARRDVAALIEQLRTAALMEDAS
jgi:coenzyme PQQ synthesis protein D (PqqD)